MLTGFRRRRRRIPLGSPGAANSDPLRQSGNVENSNSGRFNRIKCRFGLKSKLKELPSTIVPKIAESDGPLEVASDPNDLTYGSRYLINIMAIDVNGTQHFKRLTLDSRAEVNIVASDVVRDLGATIREPSVPEVAIRLTFPLGSTEPLGQVDFKWGFQGRQKVYNSAFWVVDSVAFDITSGDFDIVIGGPFIKENNLFKRKMRIWFKTRWPSTIF